MSNYKLWFHEKKIASSEKQKLDINVCGDEKKREEKSKTFPSTEQEQLEKSCKRQVIWHESEKKIFH
jgi:hypothetical protein